MTWRGARSCRLLAGLALVGACTPEPSCPPLPHGVAEPLEVVSADPFRKVTGLFVLPRAAGEPARAWAKIQWEVGRVGVYRLRALAPRRWEVERDCAIEPQLLVPAKHGIGTPTVLAAPGGLRMWLRLHEADGTQNLHLAESADGCRWQVRPEPVLAARDLGARAVVDPAVVERDGTLWMYYRTSPWTNQGNSDIALATSPDGVRWKVRPEGPVLPRAPGAAWDARLVGDPHVWRAGGAWLMLYGGNDTKTTHEMTPDEVGAGKQIGLAVSGDGVRWRRCGVVIAGGAKADNPFVEVEDGDVTVYYRKADTAAGGRLWRERWSGWPGPDWP